MVRAIAEIAVNAPVPKLFHYEVPESLRGRLELGHRVLVPFGRRSATGICVGFPSESPFDPLKPIRELLHPDCRFDAHILELTRWIADYYRAVWGEVLEAALPPPIRSGNQGPMERFVSAARPPAELLEAAARAGKRGESRARILRLLAEHPAPWVRADLLKTSGASLDVLHRIVSQGFAIDAEAPASREFDVSDLSGLSSRGGIALHADQERAIDCIRTAGRSGKFQAVLLHGVTGSGKTEVYLRALRETIERGRRGLVLVPEISLTPQMVLRFREGLPDRRISVLHSMLTQSERAREWRDIQLGASDLIIGARSAVFAPVKDLGLIVIDEEHDSSYKQDNSPRYNARDVAVMRAQRLGVPVVLGSATPCLESLHNARCGKYTLVEMPRRVTAQEIPIVTIVPLGPEFYRPDGSGLISDPLDVLIRKRLRAKEQTLLFLNRRGFATYIHCTCCGMVLKCPECDITLTYHRAQDAAQCHYCGHRREYPKTCPDCDAPGLRRSGAGTEKIISEIARRYPEARVARLDRDTARTHRALRATLSAFARGEQDILVGTQMIAKGHDFPDVTLVGIIHADTGLNFPDFRAAERTFQLITQVAGRAGRGAKAGRVILQTFFPEHFAVRCAASGDFEEFSRRELEFRKALGYPPYGRIAKILFESADLEEVDRESRAAAEDLRAAGGSRILGPVPSPIARAEGKHRRQILVKASGALALHATLASAEKAWATRRSPVDRIIDVDPQSVL